MLIRPVLSSVFAKTLLLRNKRSLQPIGPSSSTRHGWFRLPSIDQYSSLLPPAVPVWGISLSAPLDIVGLVGRCPANYLMSRMPILYHRSFS